MLCFALDNFYNSGNSRLCSLLRYEKLRNIALILAAILTSETGSLSTPMHKRLNFWRCIYGPLILLSETFVFSTILFTHGCGVDDFVVCTTICKNVRL